jgi:uncharacterized protein (TIGR03437 family)
MLRLPACTRLGFLFALLTTSVAVAQDRVTSAPDTARVRTLRGYVHPQARPDMDRGPADPAMQLGRAMLTLTPAQGLEDFLRAQQTPNSPDYHRWLTPEQFAQHFAPTGNDQAKIVAWLESQGLRVQTIARGGQAILFSGSVAAVAKAFRTEFHTFEAAGKLHFANTKEPSIPLAFERVVSGVRGFNDFRLAPMLKRPLKRANPAFTTAGGDHNLAPEDVATIYNLAPLYAAGFDGTGQTIAVLGQTDINLADIRAFRKRFNLPDNDPRVVLFGTDPGFSAADEPEADLDLEWAGAIARNAEIVYVNSTDVISSLFYAIDNNLAPVISLSYGGCEAENTPDLRNFAQQANAQGITWVNSSGDSGAAGCDFSSPTPQATKGNVVSYPASIPEVTAIGGTTLNEGTSKYWAATNTQGGGSALGYIPETAWNDSKSRNELAAGGGGASVFYPKPFWQSAPGVPNDGARDIPDISFAASPDHDGYLAQTQGGPAIFGGTSVGTPVFAGLVGILNQYLVAKGTLTQPGLGNVNPVLYRLAQSAPFVYHDVLTGDIREPCAQGTPDCVNGFLGYSAGPGYDLATGLGSLDAWQLAKQWNTGVTSTTSLVATPAAAALTEIVTLTATVTAGGTSRPTGTVVFLSSYNILGTVSLTPGPGSSAIATLGVPMVRIAEGIGTVSALYNGDGVVGASGGTSFVDLQIPTDRSLVVPSIDPNPVYQFGTSWVFSITLQELAGFPTKVTGITFDGDPVPLTVLPRSNLPAFGFVQATLSNPVGITPTAGAHVFTFSGQDVGSVGNIGKVWTQSVTAVFLPSNAPALAPSILLTSAPRNVLQNPSADPACEWSQQLLVQEQGGFLTTLSRLTVSGTNMTGQIQQIFGTTRLAPWGTLTGTVCWAAKTVTPTKTFTLSGTGEIGAVSSVATATYTNAAANSAGTPAALGLSQKALSFSVPDASQTRTATIDLTFTGGDSVWTVDPFPANRTTRWLTVSPNSGQGPGRVTVKVSAAGLSVGAYRAYLIFQATNAFPQSVMVPVTLVIGASNTLSLSGISNAASFGSNAAPGSQMRVIGLNLAPNAAQTAKVPLNLTLAGVSATVNNVTAPLFSVAPGQINLQIPYETSPGSAIVAINSNGDIVSQEIPVAIAAPGIFANQNRFLVPVSAALPGDTLALYMTGEGDVTPTLATGDGPPTATPVSLLPRPRLPVTVTVAGIQAPVVFRGQLSGAAGVCQVNFTLPQGTPPGVQSVVVTVGGISSPPVNLTVMPEPNLSQTVLK